MNYVQIKLLKFIMQLSKTPPNAAVKFKISSRINKQLLLSARSILPPC